MSQVLSIFLILGSFYFMLEFGVFSADAAGLDSSPTNVNSKSRMSNVPLAIPFEMETEEEGSRLIETSLPAGGINEKVELLDQDSSKFSSFATCDKLPVSSPTASGNDGNVPSNVLDNNLNTRWSNLGTGSWIQLDLGSKKSICSVDIAWYLGNQRQNDFIVSVSDDGTTFTQKHSGTSSGTTTSPEKYTLPAATEGRYVRITVNGNTDNDWASITEISAFGGPAGGSPSPPPVPTVPGPMYHRWQNTVSSSTSWAAYQSLGGNIGSEAAAALNPDGRLEIFVIAADKQLYHRWQTSAGSSSTWSAWTSLGGNLVGDPAVAVNSDGRLEVFAVSAINNQLYHRWQTTAGSTTAWSAWTPLGGNIKSSPAVAINSDGRLEAFVVAANNQLYHIWQNTPSTTTSWSAYQSLGGTIKGDPAVARNNDGRLEVFVIGANGNALFNKWQNTASSSTSWSAYQSLGGTLKGDPSVARNADGRLEAFVIGGGTGGGGGGGGDAGANDQFGIKKIYSTKPGGEQWFMNMADPSNDPRTSEPSMSKNSDGSWRVTSGQVRYGVFTSSGYHPDQVVKDHAILASRGYMQSPNDWKNIEMTGQVKYNSGGDDEWTWYARGGRHTGSGSPEGCEGVAYKGSLAYTGGQVRWAKEQWHVSYVFQPWRDSPADGNGKFVGFKVVMYNMQLNGQTVVKMESWVDPNNNNQWQKVYDFIDQGGWGSEGGECNGEPDQIVTWGGPIASFRWDDGNSIDIKNLSVREIVPPA
jgi:hypothetical protein